MHPSSNILVTPSSGGISNDFLTSLQNYYKIDEASGSTTVYDAHGSLDGSVVGTGFNSNLGATGISSTCLQGDGTTGHYISMGTGTEWVFTADFTISYWVYVNSTVVACKTTYPISKYQSFTGYRTFAFGYAGSSHPTSTRRNKFVSSMYNTSNTAYSAWTTSTYTSYGWYNVVTSRISNTMTIYVNGSPDGNVTVSGAMRSNNTYQLLHGLHKSSGYFEQGWLDLMDEVAIWNGRGLDDAEVATLYNSGTGLFYDNFA